MDPDPDPGGPKNLRIRIRKTDCSTVTKLVGNLISFFYIPRYREECLSHGGGKRSLGLVSDYLQEGVEPDRLAQALLEELDVKAHTVDRLLAAET
jgi:hypothetical protein